jgi:tetratricopeptide (TPR) repeat protein
VSVSWEHAYRDCTPAAAEVLRAVSALGLTSVTSPALATACSLTPAQTTACLAELAEAGWLRFGAIVERARAWLATNVTADDLVRAFTDYHADAMNDGWLGLHSAEVLAALRACDRGGLRRHGTRLAIAAWCIGAPDLRLWDELASAGEALAIADRDPVTLAELLHRSAQTFAEQGDRLRAETQWVRALAVVRRGTGNDELHEAVLAGLSELYRGWGRLGEALDADQAVVELRRTAADPIELGKALAQVASTMRAGGRLSSAAEYFAQAGEALTDTDDQALFHAWVLVSWGRVLWDQEHHGPARRRWSDALATLIDVDDKAADHVRGLLATPDGKPLPADYDGLSNTSWSSSGGNG